jgi:heptose-I-phosphate ethanolaminephosphotransferase
MIFMGIGFMRRILWVRSLGFLSVPVFYLVLNLLNYGQAGKSALLGVFAVLTVSAWSVCRGEQHQRSDFFYNLIVVLPFFSLLAIQAFLRDYFGVASDDNIVMEALFNTNSNESFEFILQNAPGIGKHLAILVLMVAGYALLLRWNRTSGHGMQRFNRKTGTRLAFLFGGIFILLHLNSSTCQDNPVLYFPMRHHIWQKNIKDTRILQDKLSATMNDPLLNSIRYGGSGPRTVVFLIGESATRLDWSLYGYSRETTPELSALGDELVWFDDVITGYPGTVGSFSQIFTPSDLKKPDLWMTEPDLLVMAKRAGYKTFWISNHNTDRSGLVSIFASHANVVEFTNKGGSRSEGSYDEVLIPPFEKALDDPAPLKFIVVHMLQGHPAYDFRYPKAYARFNGADDQVSRELKAKGRSFWAVIQRNHYDNAMLYSDHILRETLELCRKRPDQPIAWIFTPDHGEDVAHYTNFVGHNQKARSMFEVPFLFWRSNNLAMPAFEPESMRHRSYQLDTLDDTLLGLMDIRGGSYDPHHDLLSAGFQPVERSMSGVPYH